MTRNYFSLGVALISVLLSSSSMPPIDISLTQNKPLIVIEEYDSDKLPSVVDVEPINSVDAKVYVDHAVNRLRKEGKVVGNETSINFIDIECLAKNIFNEGRNEPIEGQIGIALVTYNRVKSPEYPNTFCEVVYQKSCNLKKGVYKNCTPQFSWTWDGNTKNDIISFVNEEGKIVYSEVMAWKQAVEIASDVLAGQIATFVGEATHYYNYKIVNPAWARSTNFKPVDTVIDGKIGNHRFMVKVY